MTARLSWTARGCRRYWQSVLKVNEMEPEVRALSDGELRGRTQELRGFLAAGTPLDDLLVEAFAVAREAARRVLGMRPYDVQLVRPAPLGAPGRWPHIEALCLSGSDGLYFSNLWPAVVTACDVRSCPCGMLLGSATLSSSVPT